MSNKYYLLTYLLTYILLMANPGPPGKLVVVSV